MCVCVFHDPCDRQSCSPIPDGVFYIHEYLLMCMMWCGVVCDGSPSRTASTAVLCACGVLLPTGPPAGRCDCVVVGRDDWYDISWILVGIVSWCNVMGQGIGVSCPVQSLPR